VAQTAKKREPKLVDPDKISENEPESAPEITIAQKLEGETVADTLIRARQQYGQDLRSIAQVLCIRYSYLDAIERASYENLPGPTYAVGFVRTYAEFLGLDGDTIVERFKNEVQGLNGQTKLHFPTPAPEGKMPGGAVFLVAALLFAGAYGVWFYLSNKGETLTNLVAPVPERLQELAASDTAGESAVAAGAAGESAAPAVSSPARQDEGEPAAQPSGEPATLAASAEGAVAPTPSEPAPTASSAADAAPALADPAEALPAEAEIAQDTPSASAASADDAARAAEEEVPAAPSEDGPAGSGTAAGEATVLTAPLDAAVPQTTDPAPAPTIVLRQPETPAASQQDGLQSGAVPPAPEETTPPGAGDQTAYAIPSAPESAPASSFLVNQEPQVYGSDNADARVVLRANQDAWVQVRDREGTLLLTRVLRVGDSYRVPNQEDLTLLTGNAGGLEILVDGTPLAPLGPVGAVRRNIPLDPDQLVAGAGR